MYINRLEILFKQRLLQRKDLNNFLSGDGNLLYILDYSKNIPDQRLMKYKNLYSNVGNTPVYNFKIGNNDINVKLECLNSNGNSHYARYWIIYLFLAEELGIIKPNYSHIIEVTSGNSGIALAIATKLLNYKLTIFLPKSLPTKRKQPIKDFGGNIIEVDGYIDECTFSLLSFFENKDKTVYHYPNHSEEPYSLIDYVFSRIAYEYINKHRPPDYSILGMGNGSSLYSIGKAIKTKKNSCKIISFHPDVQKDSIVLGLLSKTKLNLKHLSKAIDEQICTDNILTNNLSIEDIQRKFYYDTEIVNFGHSSLYAIAVVEKLIQQYNIENNSFFVIGYDRINRY
ncbi:MAG: PLP-dependent lyase/thiolase [Bacillota bacterium]